jgi:hypothetical protein
MEKANKLKQLEMMKAKLVQLTPLLIACKDQVFASDETICTTVSLELIQ